MVIFRNNKFEKRKIKIFGFTVKLYQKLKTTIIIPHEKSMKTTEK